MQKLEAVLASPNDEELLSIVKSCNEAELFEIISTLHKNCIESVTSHMETKADLSDALELNTAHEKTIEELTTNKPIKTVFVDSKKLSFERNNVTYTFAFPALHHNGVSITQEEVCAMEKLQDELIAIKSGMLLLS